MTRIQLRTDVTLVGDAAGEGSTILLLHAGGERRQVWAPVARRLAANGFRAIAYDLRDHGESGRTHAGSLRAHAQDVAAMVAAEPERPVIVGASLGGLAALLALREKIVRDRVAAVILVDLVPDPPADRVRSYLNAVGDGLAESPLVTDAFTRRDELRAAAAGLVDQVPLMLVRGAGSPLGDEDARRLARLVPDLHVSVVPAAGHLVARDAPAALAAAILEYLDERAVRRRIVAQPSCAPCS